MERLRNFIHNRCREQGFGRVVASILGIANLPGGFHEKTYSLSMVAHHRGSAGWHGRVGRAAQRTANRAPVGSAVFKSGGGPTVRTAVAAARSAIAESTIRPTNATAGAAAVARSV